MGNGKYGGWNSRLDENLHTTTKTEDQVESRLFLDIVVRKSASILQLLSCEDQALLVWWDSLLVLNLGLHVVDRIAGLDLQCDGLTSKTRARD